MVEPAPEFIDTVDPENASGEGMRRVVAAIIFFLLMLLLAWVYFARTAVVPELSGFPEDEAVQILEDAGFDVGAVTHAANSMEDPGCVLDQGVASGRRVLKGTDIDIVVAAVPEDVEFGGGGGGAEDSGGGGSFVLPSITADDDEETDTEYVPPAVTAGPQIPLVMGLTEAEARAELASEGLGVRVEYGPSTTSVPAGSVFYQDPAPETPKTSGQTVEIWVSTGPPVDGSPYDQPD